MKYRPTVLACYLGYVVQAIVNTFVPLLMLVCSLLLCAGPDA